ncbi:MAG TPA: methionine--tRNA ligase [Actinomycetota bacterium]|jgi:methionyl-tRNA synthetase|nr:methionine--tRNA ligase [Actinomycetota bacterium]
MGRDVFYITSAIPYVNAEPHVGTAYEIIGCDMLARFRRLRGEPVHFLTGTDEHSLNVARSAAELGITPQEWTDRMVPKWKEVWERLLISNDDFIRTSEARHTARVQGFVQRLYDRGEVYLGVYEGPYCVSCEEFKQESDLVDGTCPVHFTPVERLKEENYFFPLSKYQERLLRLYEERPEFVLPDFRRNEVVAFVRAGLRDLSISRSGSDWGIPVPWDPSHVVYVWVDALLNYITAPGFGTDDPLFERVWPCDIHVIGKDIARFHAVIWPALLMAAGLDVPRTVFVHGFLTVGGEKMSKSRGTGVHPFALLDHFAVDSYRYYFMREIQFGQDGNFSWESMVDRHNADLANGLGNLASRVLAMLGSYFDGRVPEPVVEGAEADLPSVIADVERRYDELMLEVSPTQALAAVWEVVARANQYLVEREPWAIAKDAGRREELGSVLYAAAETLRILAVLISPIMPDAAARLWAQLGVAGPLEAERLPEAARWGGLAPGTVATKGDALFPRLDS